MSGAKANTNGFVRIGKAVAAAIVRSGFVPKFFKSDDAEGNALISVEDVVTLAVDGDEVLKQPGVEIHGGMQKENDPTRR